MAINRREFMKNSAAILAAGAIGMPTEDILAMHGIPDFAAVPTVTSIAHGSWNDAATWDTGAVPGDDDFVMVNHTVTIDLITDAIAMSIGVHGVLWIFGELRVKDLLIYQDGVLKQNDGSTVLIRDVGFGANDPKQWGTGIICLGEWVAVGTPVTSAVRVVSDMRAGDTQITLSAIPVGWEVGDEIIIPRTAQRRNPRDKKDPVTTEKVTLAGIDGSTITIDPPLQFDHLSIPENSWDIKVFPHVANISRNILVASENPDGIRGHTTCVGHHVECSLESVEFRSLGRTSAFLLAIDGDAINQRGRYPIHFHHLESEGTYRIYSCSVHDNRKWGITIHDSHNGICAANVIYDSDGAGIVTEDGDELNNLILENVVIKTNRFANKIQQSDGGSGDGIWCHASGNNLIDNTCYDCLGLGVNVDGYARIGPPREPGNISGNESWACRGGMWFTWSQEFGRHDNDIRQLVTDTLVINCQMSAIEIYHESLLVFDGVTVICDPAVSSENFGGGGLDTRCCIGIDNFHNYENINHEFRNVKIYGCNIGYQHTNRPGDRGTILENAEISAYLPIAFKKADPATLHQVNVKILPSTVERIGSMPEVDVLPPEVAP